MEVTHFFFISKPRLEKLPTHMGNGIFLEKKKRAGDLAKPQDNLVLKHYITTDKAALRSWPLGPSAHIFKT